MALRLAVLGDIHGNVARARGGAARTSRRHARIASLVTGDLVFNGPRPARGR